jgi:hypothetical protein
MNTVRLKLAEWFRALDRSLWLGWTIHNHATDEARSISFPRVSLYVTDPIASWLEGEKCWLIRGREMAAAEQRWWRQRKHRRVARRIGALCGMRPVVCTA